jgi:hypothetical protein
MDVVYPYLKSSSRELELSLRSLKNIDHDRVFVIGEQPEFPVDAEIVRPLKNEWSRYSPYHDVINKLLTACELGEDLIIMNDDIFLMSHNNHDNFFRGKLLDHLNGRRFDSYARALKNTRNFLLQKGYGERDFELHVPMIVKSSLLKQAIMELMPAIRNSKPIMIRSYYGNRFEIPAEFMDDVKNPSEYQGLHVISTNEATFRGELGDYIRENV